MASTVATPLETEFGQMLPGLAQMTSASVLGSTQITLQFDLSTDMATPKTMVLEAINAAEGSLPKDMPNPPTFREINPSDAPIMILSMQSDQAPITEVDNYAENLVEQQIVAASRRGAGAGRRTADAGNSGAGRSRQAGLDGHDAGGRPHRADERTVDNPKGSIDGPQQSFTIYANDQLTKAEPYNNIIIGYRNGAADPHRRYRPCGRRPAERPVERRGPTASPRSCCWYSSRPTPTSSPPPTA